MPPNSNDLAALSPADVAEEWTRRARRSGLARVMRASQPSELNAGVTEQTRRIVTRYLDVVAGELSRPVGSALEVGCGVGRLTPTIAARAGRVTAIDMTARMLEQAAETCSALSTVEFQHCRAERFPSSGPRFDVSVCVWVLMHVLDEDRLAEAGRVLAARSRYLILIEYERAYLPVSRWARPRSIEEYLAVLPGATMVRRQPLDYGGDLSTAALIGFPTPEDGHDQ